VPGALYLDTSAFVKLVVPEPETPALLRALEDYELLVCSEILVVEALRACSRYGDAYSDGARQALLDVALIPLTRDLLVAAGELPPPDLRSMDAIHLASALSRATHLEALACYDERLILAARQAGLTCVTPGRT
jgi:uncharacterized protein